MSALEQSQLEKDQAAQALQAQVKETLAHEASLAQIQIDYLPLSTTFTGPAAYADHYNVFEKRKMIGWVAQKLITQPDETLEFTLRAGQNEKDRDFSAMKDNLEGYCTVLAEVASEKGYTFKIILSLNGKYTEFDRSDGHKQALPDDQSKPVRYILIEEHLTKASIYNAGALVGYKMQVHPVDSDSSQKGK